MKIINRSQKIISIADEALLPGNDMDLPEGYEKHPSIAFYLESGMLVDALKAGGRNDVGMSDEERAKIAEEAVARYKAEQEALTRAQEIKAVNKMKKDELVSKAIGMGIEISDSDTAEAIRTRILEQFDQ